MSRGEAFTATKPGYGPDSLYEHYGRDVGMTQPEGDSNASAPAREAASNSATAVPVNTRAVDFRLDASCLSTLAPLLGQGLGSATHNEAAGKVLFRLDSERIELATTDGVCEMRYKIADSDEKRSRTVFAVEGARLVAILKNGRQDSDIKVHYDPGSHQCRLTSSRQRYRLATTFDTDENHFPFMRGKPGGEARLPGGQLLAGLTHVDFAASDDPYKGRRSLCGVHCYVRDGDRGLTLEACDGVRLARMTLELPQPLGEHAPDIVIPGDSCKILSRVMRYYKGDVVVRWDGARALFDFTAGDKRPALRLSTLLIAEPYPSLDAIFPKEFDAHLKVTREAFNDALRAIAAFAKSSLGVRLGVDSAGERAWLSSAVKSGNDDGEAELDVESGNLAGSVEVGYGYEYLNDILSVAAKHENILFDINAADKAKATRVRLEKTPGYVFIVMPRKI